MQECSQETSDPLLFLLPIESSRSKNRLKTDEKNGKHERQREGNGGKLTGKIFEAEQQPVAGEPTA